jgi:hypothetical protein
MKSVRNIMDSLRFEDGVVYVPFLVKGSLVAAPGLSRSQVESAFKNCENQVDYIKLPDAQIVRGKIIDRRTLRYTGEYQYRVMPVVNPWELVETDIDALAHGLYSLPVDGILSYLDAVSSVLGKNRPLLDQVLEIERPTSPYPDIFLDAWFRSLTRGWGREEAASMISNELSSWGKPGSAFLDGWVELPAEVAPGAMPNLSHNVFPGSGKRFYNPGRALLRAMPTRQLHITAGNTPDVLLVSALRAILTKSAAVIKLPAGGTLTGALFAIAAAAEPCHPLTRHLSLVYWQGGDETVEKVLFDSGAFDRIVVWGDPATVASVRSRTVFTRIISLNPRYGISLIGCEAFNGSLEEVAVRAAADSMFYNQRACASSLVHYIEAGPDEVEQYAGVLCRMLAEWDEKAPQFVSPSAVGRIKQLKRGRYGSGRWFINEGDGRYSSGVVIVGNEFDINEHPASRLVVVRPVVSLSDAMKYINPGVSSAGVYPESRRTGLRDAIAARGVSSVLPLGEAGRMFPGMPHDGMPVLSQLVDWKTA